MPGHMQTMLTEIKRVCTEVPLMGRKMWVIGAKQPSQLLFIGLSSESTESSEHVWKFEGMWHRTKGLYMLDDSR